MASRPGQLSVKLHLAEEKTAKERRREEEEDDEGR